MATRTNERTSTFRSASAPPPSTQIHGLFGERITPSKALVVSTCWSPFTVQFTDDRPLKQIAANFRPGFTEKMLLKRSIKNMNKEVKDWEFEFELSICV